MKDTDYSKTFEKYHKKSLFWIRAALIISILILFLPTNFFSKLLFSVVLFFIISTASLTSLRNKYIEPVLLNDLDPQGYRELTRAASIKSVYALEEIKAAYFMGEYDEVERLCREKLEIPKCKIHKPNYLLFLARVYFDKEDFKALSWACREFDREVAGKRNEAVLRKTYIAFSYFKMYLCDDMQGCLSLYKELYFDEKLKKHPLFEIQISYLYGFALLKTGDAEGARAVFEYIEKRGRRLNYARLARKQLTFIDNPEYGTYEMNFEAEKGEAPVIPEPKKAKAGIWVVFALCMAVIIGYSVYTSVGQKPCSAVDAVEKKDDVSAVLTDAEVNESGDMLMVYENGEGEICVAYLDCRGEDKYICRTVLDGIYEGASCTVSAADSDLKIHFALYSESESIPEGSVMSEKLTAFGRELYFCIEKIEEKNILFDSSSLVSGLLLD